MLALKSKVLATAFAAAALLCGASFSANAAMGIGPQIGQLKPVNMDEILMVSDFELNRFLFQAPLKKLHFPNLQNAADAKSSPLLTPPVYLSGNTQVLLQFNKGDTKPIQVVFELADGRVFPMRVAPRPVPGESHYISDGKDERNTKRQQTSEGDSMPTPRQEDIETMKALASFGEPPAGYSPTTLPATARFDKFTVVPLSGWSDGEKQAFVFSIIAAPGETAVVAPPQFYRPGITAVMVDGDVVDEKNSPTLYVIEELKNE